MMGPCHQQMAPGHFNGRPCGGKLGTVCVWLALARPNAAGGGGESSGPYMSSTSILNTTFRDKFIRSK